MSPFFIKPRFDSALDIRAYRPETLAPGERQLYILRSPLVYQSAILGEITVPIGTVTDFASIPRAALWYVDDDDPCILYPSVIHDELYTLGGRLADGRIYTRAQADAVLREGMLACGARADQATLVFGAVRMFGGSHWTPAAPTPST